VFEEAKVADRVRCPYCGASRIHKDGYTDKGATKYHRLNCGVIFILHQCPPGDK